KTASWATYHATNQDRKALFAFAPGRACGRGAARAWRNPACTMHAASGKTKWPYPRGTAIYCVASTRAAAAGASRPTLLLQRDFHVDAGRPTETHQGVHGLVGGIHDVHQALVRANLELVARRLVHVGRTQHVVATDARGQRHGATNHGASTLGGIDDFCRRLIDQLVVESFQADADLLVFHGDS